MSITYGDHLIDIGHYDITPEQEREIESERDLTPDEDAMVDAAWRYHRDALCPTCGGRREVGWFDPAEAAYRSEPCDCYRPGDCDGSCTHPEPEGK